MDVSIPLQLTVDGDLNTEEVSALGDFVQDVVIEALRIQDLIGECGGPFSVHPDYPPADWMSAVESFDTRLGYWDWVLARLDQNDDDNDDAPPDFAIA